MVFDFVSEIIVNYSSFNLSFNYGGIERNACLYQRLPNLPFIYTGEAAVAFLRPAGNSLVWNFNLGVECAPLLSFSNLALSWKGLQ